MGVPFQCDPAATGGIIGRNRFILLIHSNGMPVYRSFSHQFALRPAG
jgi:hypothetical protein